MAGETRNPAASFTELYQSHSREVYQFALYLSGDPALAEDIVSETFLRIWDSAATVRMETVRGYLFTIARNLFLHSLGNKRKQDPLEDTHSVAATAARDLELKEDLRDTLAALQTLPEVDRAAVLLRAQEGVSYEEIAHQTSYHRAMYDIPGVASGMALWIGEKHHQIQAGAELNRPIT